VLPLQVQPISALETGIVKHRHQSALDDLVPGKSVLNSGLHFDVENI
jgi:hypothetical protein